MSVRLQVSVEGGRTLIVNLQNFSEALQQQVQDSLAIVGARILQDMRNFTPVRTGFLLSTENMEEVGSSAFVIYARAFYAPFVEWGTSRMAPRLFMTRAFELHKDEVQQEIWNSIANLAANMFR
jgi:HK97 gp10 family phage protein